MRKLGGLSNHYEEAAGEIETWMNQTQPVKQTHINEPEIIEEILYVDGMKIREGEKSKYLDLMLTNW